MQIGKPFGRRTTRPMRRASDLVASLTRSLPGVRPPLSNQKGATFDAIVRAIGPDRSNPARARLGRVVDDVLLLMTARAREVSDAADCAQRLRRLKELRGDPGAPMQAFAPYYKGATRAHEHGTVSCSGLALRTMVWRK